MKLPLVYCYDLRAWEQDWLHHLLSDFDVEVVSAPDFSHVASGALYVVLGSDGLGHVPARFLAGVKEAGGCGLVHLGDEFLRGPYDTYSAFSFVLRNYRAPFLKTPGVLQFPLGYSNGLPKGAPPRASARRYAWSFIGAANIARARLGEAWRGFGPNFFQLSDIRHGQAHLGRDVYLDLLEQSAFMPCPMGNTQLETMRMYEVLERGGIPVLPRRRTSSYFEDLFGGDHRLPTFFNWQEAREWAEDLFSRPTELDRIQAEVGEWWARKKIAIREEVHAFVTAGRAGDHATALRDRFRSFRLSPFTRYAVHASYHDATAVEARLHIIGKRIVTSFSRRTG